MSQISAEDIIRLYLFGRNENPTNLIDNMLIRDSGSPVKIDVNFSDYLAGPGRFAGFANFAIVQEFMDPWSMTIPAGEYTKADIISR